MKKYYDPEDIRMADVIAVEKYGIPSLSLMENAGKNAACELMSVCPMCKKILIVAGPGNNGGDGFVAARYLIKAGKTVNVVTSVDNEKYNGDAKINLYSLLKIKDLDCTVKCSKTINDDEITRLVKDCDYLIDALLGTGTSGAPRGEIVRLIHLCKKDGAVMSLDIPSGINPKTGEIYSSCVQADVTVSFLALKTGMSLSPAKEMCGNIITVDIGIDAGRVLINRDALSCYDRNDLSGLLFPIARDIHKGDRGGVLVLGGSQNYRGAPVLAALGALRSGAGFVVLALPDFMIESASVLVPEAVFLPLKTSADIILPEFLEETIVPWIKKCGAAIVGPGLGRNKELKSVIRWFWNYWKKPLLLDADALFFLSELQNELTKRNDTVITPHSGEAANILNLTPNEVNADRFISARALTINSEVAVLKGKNTLVASDKETRMILEGSPVLAVPGSGDVLSGSIGAMLASGMSVLDSATAGVLAHATAGSILEARKGLRGTLAREIADALPDTFRQ